MDSSPCHTPRARQFEYMQSTPQAQTQVRAVISRRGAVGQRSYKGPAKLPGYCRVAWVEWVGWAPGPLALAAPPGLFLTLGLLVWPLLNGPLLADVWRR